MHNPISSRAIAIGFLAILAVGLCSISIVSFKAKGAEFPDPRVSNAIIASSTAYALTAGSAQRIVATTTPPGVRTALTVQAANCSVAGSVVYFDFLDRVPVANTGVMLTASSTLTFADTVPLPAGSIRALSSVGNCTLLVTEWRTAI